MNKNKTKVVGLPIGKLTQEQLQQLTQEDIANIAYYDEDAMVYGSYDEYVTDIEHGNVNEDEFDWLLYEME